MVSKKRFFFRGISDTYTLQHVLRYNQGTDTCCMARYLQKNKIPQTFCLTLLYVIKRFILISGYYDNGMMAYTPRETAVHMHTGRKKKPTDILSVGFYHKEVLS